MRIESPLAIEDQDRIFDDYDIDQDNLVMVDEQIAQQTDPEFGRPGRVNDTGELVISNTPYLVAYRILGDGVRILRVLHSRQLRPDRTEAGRSQIVPLRQNEVGPHMPNCRSDSRCKCLLSLKRHAQRAAFRQRAFGDTLPNFAKRG